MGNFAIENEALSDCMPFSAYLGVKKKIKKRSFDRVKDVSVRP